MTYLWSGPPGFLVGFPLLWYSVVCTIESLSMYYLLFIYLDLYVLGDYTSMS